jgi:hypothetical protein
MLETLRARKVGRTAIPGDAGPLHPRQQVAFVLISIASFFFYVLAALSLHQESMQGWALEAEGAFPAAISNSVYGTPLGAVDWNVRWALTETVARSSEQMEQYFREGNTIQNAFAVAAHGGIPRGDVMMEGSIDGLGAGSNLFAVLGTWLFGLNIQSIILFYLVFVGISAFAFVWRFRDERLLVMPVYFLVVTIMLLTPLGTSAEGIWQTPIGGNRYFTLAAILPALHIFFEIIEPPRAERLLSKSRLYVPLFVQGLLLFGALLVRSAAGYLLGVLIATLFWRLYTARRQRPELSSLFTKSAVIGATFAFWATIVIVALPTYVETGRALGAFWHRAVRSFAMHPDWPFGNLREVYNCTNSDPGGLGAVSGDAIGACIVAADPSNADRPLESRDLLDGNYERVLRHAYFYILTHYPRQVFQTYFSIKSTNIKEGLADALTYLTGVRHAPVAAGLFIIAAAQLVLLVWFFISTAWAGRLLPDWRMMIIPVFFLFSIAPRYVAWSGLGTDADMICLFYGSLVMGVLFLVKFAINLYTACGFTRRVDSAPAAPVRG